MILEKAVDRLREVASGQPSLQTRQRMRMEAEQITQTGAIAAHVAVMQEAIAKLLRMLYEIDADGTQANYDYDGKILIPVPWGNAGWRVWGLRKWEADCLRRVLKSRLRKGYPTPFDFSTTSLRWYLRIDLYPTLDHAIDWLQEDGIGIKEWRGALENNKKRREKRRQGLP
jgi:hypothetical protein